LSLITKEPDPLRAELSAEHLGEVLDPIFSVDAVISILFDHGESVRKEPGLPSGGREILSGEEIDDREDHGR
jgi:hypothetical protein